MGVKHEAPDSLLSPAEAAAHLRISRSTVLALIQREGLPCLVLSSGPGGRRIVRFRAGELDAWLEGRRARQLADWSRYSRKVAT